MKLKICFYLLTLTLSINSIFAQDNQKLTVQTPPTEEKLSRYEIGAQFSAFEGSGFGGRFTFNINKNVALEAEGNFFPRVNFPARSLEGLFGIKVGKRWNKFGVFGKTRPGFIYRNRGKYEFGGTVQNPIIKIAGRTDPVIDLGGVVEFYPTTRIITRFDFGDTIRRTGQLTGVFLDQNNRIQTYRSFSTVSHQLQFSAGVGFRF